MSKKKDPTIAIADAILQVSSLLGVVADQIIKDPRETKGRKSLAKMSKTVAKTAKKIATKAKTPAKPKRQVIAVPCDSQLARILMNLCCA